jgi:hypothetical protein
MWHVLVTGEFHTGFWWGGPEGNSPLERPRRRGEDNIKIDIQYIGWEGMYWIHMVKDGYGWQALYKCGNKPSEFQKFQGIS